MEPNYHGQTVDWVSALLVRSRRSRYQAALDAPQTWQDWPILVSQKATPILVPRPFLFSKLCAGARSPMGKGLRHEAEDLVP